MYTVEITKHDDVYYGVVKGVAQYILRGRMRKSGRVYSPAQILARARHDLAAMVQYGYTSDESDVTRVVAEAGELADRQQDTNANWNDWAFGH